MLKISPEQLASLTADAREEFLLETVADYFALFAQCYERPSRILFEGAWQTAEYLLNRLIGLPLPEGQAIDYTLIHALLCAFDKGATTQQLREGVDAFCMALPAHEAGLILLESICAMNSDDFSTS